ncbi:MAG: hypothetical protein AAB650_00800 [Patescibacteria group bacterium]
MPVVSAAEEHTPGSPRLDPAELKLSSAFFIASQKFQGASRRNFCYQQ